MSSTRLRQIDFRTARDNWLKTKKIYKAHQHEMTDVYAEQLQRILGRDGVSEGYLANLANVYVQLVRTGERSIAAKLAEITGRSPDTIKQHLHRVRKEKMLTSISGKAGGQLTQKAIDTIRAASRQHATHDGFVPNA